jgi:hypothetical protein
VDAVEQAGLIEAGGGPLVELVEARGDDGVVKEAAEAVLVSDIAFDVLLQGIAFGEDAAEGEEDAGHAEAGVAEDAAERGEPAERQPRRADAGVGVEDAQQGDVHEEALRGAFGFGEPAMLEVGDDAGVVGAVQVGSGGLRNEGEPVPHRGGGGLAGEAADEGDGLAAVAEEALVARPPPDAAGRCVVEGVEEAAVDLPAHEGERGAAKREVAGALPAGPL